MLPLYTPWKHQKTFRFLLFSDPLKTPENLWFSFVFRGYKLGTLARNGLKLLSTISRGLHNLLWVTAKCQAKNWIQLSAHYVTNIITKKSQIVKNFLILKYFTNIIFIQIICGFPIARSIVFQNLWQWKIDKIPKVFRPVVFAETERLQRFSGSQRRSQDHRFYLR